MCGKEILDRGARDASNVLTSLPTLLQVQLQRHHRTLVECPEPTAGELSFFIVSNVSGLTCQLFAPRSWASASCSPSTARSRATRAASRSTRFGPSKSTLIASTWGLYTDHAAPQVRQYRLGSRPWGQDHFSGIEEGAHSRGMSSGCGRLRSWDCWPFRSERRFHVTALQ